MSGNMLRELAESIFGEAWSRPAGPFDAQLWTTCEKTGLARLTLPEKAGGSAGSFADAATVLCAAGRFAAPVPLVDTDLVAGWLLHTVGIEVPPGPLTAVVASSQDLTEPGRRVSGSLRRVPWGRAVSAVAVLSTDQVLLIDATAADVTEGMNVAEEPRDDLRLTDAPVQVAPVPAGGAEEYALRAALGRSFLLAGAAQAAVTMAVRYATERIQFGRPIAKLQAIQQMLALAAAETAAATASVEAAAQMVDALGVTGAATAIAVAKVRTGAAAGTVARIAHQVHGAIGFTREHDLRRVTTRLWAWRDEDGGEDLWAERLGKLALQAGPDGLWPMLTT